MTQIDEASQGRREQKRESWRGADPGADTDVHADVAMVNSAQRCTDLTEAEPNGFLVRCRPGAEYHKLILETLKLAPYTRTGSRTQDLSRFRLWKSPNRSRAHLLPALELPREPLRRRRACRLWIHHSMEWRAPL